MWMHGVSIWFVWWIKGLRHAPYGNVGLWVYWPECKEQTWTYGGGINTNTMKMPLSPRLSIYRWQPGMLASVAHRASGVVLVLFVPIYLYLLQGLAGTPEDFAAVQAWLHAPFGRTVLWLTGASLIYHFFNGIRFLCLDAGWGENREMMRLIARVVVGIGFAAVAVLGVMLW